MSNTKTFTGYRAKLRPHHFTHNEGANCRYCGKELSEGQWVRVHWSFPYCSMTCLRLKFREDRNVFNRGGNNNA